MVTQSEVDQELHTYIENIKADCTGLDNTKEIRDTMLDQVMWKYFVSMAQDESRPK